MMHHDDSTEQLNNPNSGTDSQQSFQDTQNALDHCQQELQEWKDKCIRLGADFENFKRRQEKERLLWSRVAQVEILKGLLEIVDNFERALQQNKESVELQTWRAGFELIYKELLKYLHSVGVEEITEKSTFNPELHEAVMSVAQEGVSSGTIVAILQKGYMFKGSILRPAKVSIAE